MRDDPEPVAGGVKPTFRPRTSLACGTAFTQDPTTIRRSYIRLTVLVSSRTSFETPTPTKL